MDSTPRLILLPGLGGDSRLFEPQRAAFPDLEVPKWLPPEPSETLADYSHRMTTTIDQREPFYLGGVSLGGMVAQEMARHVQPRAVILIGSCRSGSALPAYFKWYERLTRPLPTKALEVGRLLAPLLAGKLDQLDPRQTQLFVNMLNDTPMEFVRWASKAAIRWSGAPFSTMPIRHIHGDHDRLIPIANVEPDHVVPGAGHLPNLTHPEEVNQFLTRIVAVQDAGA